MADQAVMTGWKSASRLKVGYGTSNHASVIPVAREQSISRNPGSPGVAHHFD